MYVSKETRQQTDARLLRVMAMAELIVFPVRYAFVEVDARHFPSALIPQALAFVRDEDVWSAFVPTTSSDQEQFVVFSFHFPPNEDNSGFMGWLASHLKATLGTGVLVVCGQNSSRGGIFDYWGAPEAVADNVVRELQRLRAWAGAEGRSSTAGFSSSPVPSTGSRP